MGIDADKCGEADDGGRGGLKVVAGGRQMKGGEHSEEVVCRAGLPKRCRFALELVFAARGS